MVILLLKGYNNYFNRIVKIEDDIYGYKTASASYLEYDRVNFDPRDGIATTLVVGSETQLDASKDILSFDDLGCPDYLVCYSDTDKYDIKSRWFVIECVKVMAGQYRLALKRDVLADFNSQVMQSPCFVEKGSITDVSSPLLHNSEGMVFNQIKQSEDFIKDDSKCAWLVGYVKKGIDASDLTSVNPITYTSPDDISTLPEADSFAWEPAIQYFDMEGDAVNQTHKDCFWLSGSETSFRTKTGGAGVYRNCRTTFDSEYRVVYNASEQWATKWNDLDFEAFNAGMVNKDYAKVLTNMICSTTLVHNPTRDAYKIMVDYAKYLKFDDKCLVNEDIAWWNNHRVVKNNKVYRLSIFPGEYTEVNQLFSSQDAQAATWMQTVAQQVAGITYESANPAASKIKISFKGKEYQIYAREEPVDETMTFNFPASGLRNECLDATYDMFAMPVNPSSFGLTVSTDDVVIAYKDSNQDTQAINLSSISDKQLTLAMKLCTGLGAGGSASMVYDLQLLPYCPFEGLNAYFDTHYGPTYGKYVIDTTSCASEDCTLIWNSAETPAVRGVIFYPKHANFSKTISYSVPNMTVHYEPQRVVNPTFTYNNTVVDGRPQYIFMDWPYECTDGVYDIDSDEWKFDSLTVRPASISVTVSTGAKKPLIVLYSDDLPLNPTPSQQVQVNCSIEVTAHWVLPDTAEDIKVQNECDLYRLASPNYNAVYEFKNTKLVGGIQTINVDCTYKPFTPYIKLNPNYQDSYYSVQDFNDSMGLICNGDFSIPMLSDAWVNYELQNRNYQAIFNRQIQNLDVNNQIAKEKQQFTDTMGIITAGVGGAAGAGFAAAKGNYVGAAMAAGSGIAGMAVAEIKREKDQDWLERQQTEARSFAVDNFQYQLGNVQALNPTITKSTPLTYNNKVWPILEKFSCKEQEKDVLRNKLKYDGMTVMAIGRLVDYSAIGGYLKGKLIRLEGLEDDSHIAQAIYEAVDRGFYQGE